MNQLLYDIYQYQVWADDQHWKMYNASPYILDDEKIRKRVQHIYQTQRAFLLVCRKQVLGRRLLVEQAAMHGHYHRGQNATGLRELGGSPPLTDLTIWYSKGSPKTQY